MEQMQGTPVRSEVSTKVKGWNKLAPALLISALCAAPTTQAALISQDSSFGTGSITLDSDTGLQWLDPWLATVAGGGTLNSFNDVSTQFSAGGLFEGYRYATRLEVDTLFFTSAGINAVTSQSQATATSSDISGVAYLMSFFDTTYEQNFGPDAYIRILDAVFDDGAGGADQTVLKSSKFGPTPGGGVVQFHNDPNLANNSNPYGHLLVRDIVASSSSGAGGVPVDEPQNLALFGLALAAALRLRRKPSRSAD